MKAPENGSAGSDAASDEQLVTACDYDRWMTQNSLGSRWARFWFSPARTVCLNTPARHLARTMGLAASDRVLDVGCGCAGLLIYLLRKLRFTHTLEGLDCSPRMIEWGGQEVLARGLEGRIRLRQGLATALPYADGAFDAVLCTYVVKHLSDPLFRQMLREVRRVLGPSGRFCLWEAAPSRYAFMRAWNLRLLRMGMSVVHLRTAGQLCACLEEAGFAELRPYGHGLYYYYPPLPRVGYIARQACPAPVTQKD